MEGNPSMTPLFAYFGFVIAFVVCVAILSMLP